MSEPHDRAFISSSKLINWNPGFYLQSLLSKCLADGYNSIFRIQMILLAGYLQTSFYLLIWNLLSSSALPSLSSPIFCGSLKAGTECDPIREVICIKHRCGVVSNSPDGVGHVSRSKPIRCGHGGSPPHSRTLQAAAAKSSLGQTVAV